MQSIHTVFLFIYLFFLWTSTLPNCTVLKSKPLPQKKIYIYSSRLLSRSIAPGRSDRCYALQWTWTVRVRDRPNAVFRKKHTSERARQQKHNVLFTIWKAWRPLPRRNRGSGHRRDVGNDRWSLYAYEDALLPGHDPVRNKGVFAIIYYNNIMRARYIYIYIIY